MKTRIFHYVFLVGLTVVFWAGKPELPKAKAKVMEKNFVSVTETLFAARYEVSNIDYKEFLATLQHDPAQYKALNVRSEMWDETLAFSDPIKENYFSHPAFDAYPVVNVTHEAAQAYCEWLTQLYHEDERRTYKKVVFRLPSAEEWAMAAQAGDENNPYPWGGPYLRNKKGQYLCNFQVIPQHLIAQGENKDIQVAKGSNRFQGDSFLLTAPVDAFAANDWGLYNMSGNAAEMTATAGLARGGSWADTGYDVRIQSEKSFEVASPEVGFRVFMEVLEF